MHKLLYWQNEWNKKLISKFTAFFISSIINCVINVKDEKREEVIDRNESDKSKDKETWESEENKNEDNITEEHVLIATETF